MENAMAALYSHGYFIHCIRKIHFPDNKNEFIVYNQCKIHNPFSIKNYTFFNR